MEQAKQPETQPANGKGPLIEVPMPYAIVGHADIAQLGPIVSNKIEEGYEPVGTPFFFVDRSLWCQAIFKRPLVASVTKFRPGPSGGR